MEEKKSNFTLYLMGGIFGAFLGIIAAILIEKSSENEGGDVHLTSKKLTKLGFGTISALWSLIDPGKGLLKK
jgi:hypothetical protein